MIEKLDMIEDEKVRRSTNQARGGSTPHIVRYILAISLGLALVAMAVVYFTYFKAGEVPTAQEQVENGAPR